MEKYAQINRPVQGFQHDTKTYFSNGFVPFIIGALYIIILTSGFTVKYELKPLL